MRPLILSVALVVSAGRGQEIYDLVLKNGQVIDPANRRNGRFDLAVIGDRIVRVGRDLPAAHARVVVDASQYYVTPGLIDIHTHFDAQGAALNVLPDYNALPSGVTTAVDAGGSGWKNFEAFKTAIIDRAKVRLLAFLNIAAAGIGPSVETDASQLDAEAAARMVRKYPQVLVGIAAAHSEAPDAVERAVKAAESSGTIVMVDFGRGEPGPFLKRLRPGDILTHMYSRLIPQPWTREARQRGVLFDVGHGAAGLWFRIAAPAIREGFLPDTISTDIDKDSIMLPRANMITTMSKFLNLGLSLEQVIERSTVNPARAIHRPDLGTLSEGAVADIAVLELEKGSFGFLDSGHARLTGDRRLRSILTVRNGAIVWDSAGLSTPDSIKAGPYSNFK